MNTAYANHFKLLILSITELILSTTIGLFLGREDI